MTDANRPTEGMRARKKPVVIEYMHFHSPGRECIGRIQAWISREGGQSTWHYAVSSNDFQIKTLEGWMQANVGDYIIKGVKGEFYPCKPDIFTMTYETDFAPGASGCGHVPAGYSCVTPGCSNGPAPEPEDLRAEVERLRVERYLCVLAMRCAMGAHHDGVDAMRERLEPVVARYGIATACAARAAISDADAACIEAQYSRSEIAGSSGEPRDECRCIPMAPRPWNFCTDCGGRIPETKGEKP